MTEGKYIYCIITVKKPKQGSSKKRTFGPLGIGGRGDELYTIHFDGIAAVISNSPIAPYPVSRENTLAHEKAIEEVMKEFAVLPVRFATIAEDEKKVKRILKEERGKFKGLFEELKDKKELGLKVVLKEDVIYKDILEKYKDIRALKEKVAALPPEASVSQRMEIGRQVEAALGRERELYKDEIMNALSPLAVEVKLNPNYWEMMVINAAFLVEKKNEPEFDKAVQSLDGKYGDRMKFKYVGTLPPFNFVNLVIDTGKY